MLKRYRNLTIATNGPNVGAYYQPTPYRSYFVGLCWMRLAQFGRTHTPGVKAFIAGPVVCGRYDLQDALSTKAVR